MKTLNDYFDKCIYVNLDIAEDRRRSCEEQFERFSITAERYPAVAPNVGNNFLSKGCLGILLSNKNIINMCIEQKLNNVLIMEDDVLLVDDFNTKLDYTMKHLPDDWDFMYFGGNHLVGRLIDVNDYIKRMTYSYAIHMIAIKNTMYEKILTKLKCADKPVDVLYAELFSGCNAYTCKNSLATQKAGFSFIENDYKNYDYCLKY